VLIVNLALAVFSGGRSAGFLPLVLYVIGLFLGCTPRQRTVFAFIAPVVAIPLIYIFGMIEVVRSDLGRFNLNQINSENVSNVMAGLKTKGEDVSGDPYSQLPSWVRSNFRMVTWPTFMVATTAASSVGYRGFSDLGDEIFASLNIVTLTGQYSDYYSGGLYNLRASAYGFTVDEGTSVEFGLIPESWDRGGPVAAFAYSLVTVGILFAVESLIRRMLSKQPAFRAITVSVVVATAYWTLNIYNLPLSLRHMAVNLVLCLVLFGIVNILGAPDEIGEDTQKRIIDEDQVTRPKRALRFNRFSRREE
jgi:hypothetical protein